MAARALAPPLLGGTTGAGEGRGRMHAECSNISSFSASHSHILHQKLTGRGVCDGVDWLDSRH